MRWVGHMLDKSALYSGRPSGVHSTPIALFEMYQGLSLPLQAVSPEMVKPPHIPYATPPASSARDHLHLGGGPAGGRDEHLASGVGVSHGVGLCWRAVERHALHGAAGR